MPHECASEPSPPGAICNQSVAAPTCTGVDDGVSVPLASWPLLFDPQHQRLRVGLRLVAQAWLLRMRTLSQSVALPTCVGTWVTEPGTITPQHHSVPLL